MKPIFVIRHPQPLSEQAINNLKTVVPQDIKDEYHVIVVDGGMETSLHNGIDWQRLQALADEMGISQSEFWNMTLNEFNDKLREHTQTKETTMDKD